MTTSKYRTQQRNYLHADLIIASRILRKSAKEIDEDDLVTSSRGQPLFLIKRQSYHACCGNLKILRRSDQSHNILLDNFFSSTVDTAIFCVFTVDTAIFCVFCRDIGLCAQLCIRRKIRMCGQT